MRWEPEGAATGVPADVFTAVLLGLLRPGRDIGLSTLTTGLRAVRLALYFDPMTMRGEGAEEAARRAGACEAMGNYRNPRHSMGHLKLAEYAKAGRTWHPAPAPAPAPSLTAAGQDFLLPLSLYLLSYPLNSPLSRRTPLIPLGHRPTPRTTRPFYPLKSSPYAQDHEIQAGLRVVHRKLGMGTIDEHREDGSLLLSYKGDYQGQQVDECKRISSEGQP
jgi:hypothetical protein